MVAHKAVSEPQRVMSFYDNNNVCHERHKSATLDLCLRIL
jgi:hypothetical protein